MKKIAIIIMLFALIVSTLGGCVKTPKDISANPSASQSGDREDDMDDTEPSDAQSADDDSDESDVSLSPATNPSEGYANYMTVKGTAYDRISDASENSDALLMAVGLGFLGVTLIDMSLITLTMLSDDLESSQMAMGILGMTGAKITGGGNDYTITYTDTDGASIKQTCTYDAAKDQMTAALYDAEGKVAVFFEYVNLGDAYAAQYYSPSDDGYEVITSYFDMDNISAFGVVTQATEPESIIGKTSFNADFVKNEQSYMILADGKLTVFDQGSTTTN